MATVRPSTELRRGVGEEGEVTGERDERERWGPVVAAQDRRQLRDHVDEVRILVVVADHHVVYTAHGEVVEQVQHGSDPSLSSTLVDGTLFDCTPGRVGD
jgi:hypothetical protein